MALRRRKKPPVEIVPLESLPWFFAPEVEVLMPEESAPSAPVSTPPAVETRSYTTYLRDREEVFGEEGRENTLTYREWAEWWAHATPAQSPS